MVIKGDSALDSTSGVLNYQGVGMNGRGYEISDTSWVEGDDSRLRFNNLNFVNSHVFSFTTMNTPADQGGICSVDKVLISPDSYLFPENTNSIKENDNDSVSSGERKRKSPNFGTFVPRGSRTIHEYIIEAEVSGK